MRKRKQRSDFSKIKAMINLCMIELAIKLHVL